MERPTIAEQMERRFAEQAQEDQAGLVSSAIPLPGPAAGAFSVLPPVKVGPYSVREFVDADYETLQQLEHPLLSMIETAYMGMDTQGKSDDEKKQLLDEMAKRDDRILRQISRGHHAWELCWIMTHDPVEVDSVLRKAGVQNLRDQARAEFSRRRFPALALIVSAAVEQMTLSWSTRLAVEPVKTGEQEAPATLPPSSGGHSMVSAGSSTNGSS